MSFLHYQIKRQSWSIKNYINTSEIKKKKKEKNNGIS